MAHAVLERFNALCLCIWLGFVICDIAMLIAHGLLLGFTVCLVGAISWPSKYVGFHEITNNCRNCIT